MPVCKFRGTVTAKIFLEINILRAILGDLFVTATSIRNENDILRFPEGAHALRIPLRTPLDATHLKLLLYSGTKAHKYTK